MKITHITTALGNGGAEAAMYRLICFNEHNQHSVICLTGSGVYQDLLLERGVEVHLLNMKDHMIPIAPLVNLYKILKLLKPDAVQTWMYHANLFGGLVAKACCVPKIYWGIRMSNPKAGSIGKVTRGINWVCGKLGKIIPTQIVSCAHRATEEHIKLGYPPSRMVTICNGYDTSTMHRDEKLRAEIRTRFNIPNDTVLLGTVARWHPQKDHRTLCEALSQIKDNLSVDWKLILVGPDMHKSNLELASLLNEFNLAERCILADQQSNVSAFLSAMDIHVLSSSDEGFPNVIAEAMACGTPCVSTDAGDAGFIIDNTGWLSPIKDPTKLGTNIETALAEFQQSEQWDLRTQRCVERIDTEFSIEHMAKQFSQLWSSTPEIRN